MCVYIDDSGDPGFKFGQGSSDFLVIACCIFETVEDVVLTSSLVSELSRDLNSRHAFELKFHKSRHENRIKFLNKLKDSNFFLRVLVIDKRKLKPTPDLLVEMICIALHDSRAYLHEAKVQIDGFLPRKIARIKAQKIRAVANRESLIVKSVQFRGSETSELIQLADMIAGTVRKIFESSGEVSKEYLKALEPLMKSHKSAIWHLNEK